MICQEVVAEVPLCHEGVKGHKGKKKGQNLQKEKKGAPEEGNGKKQTLAKE
jgi:hypothetical protein